MGAGIDLQRLTLQPLVDGHTSAVMLATEAVAVGGGEPWAASVLDRLGAAQRRALRPMAETGLIPDVVIDIEHHGRDWRKRLAGVATAPPRDLVAELAGEACPLIARSWREVVRAPERWLATVAAAIGRVLPIAHGLLAAEREPLTRLVREIAGADDPERVADLLADLHPRTRIAGGRWTLAGSREPLPPADDRLLVVPALATPEWSSIAREGEAVKTLFAGVAVSERDHVALTTLLGTIRTALMRRLFEPQTMKALAEHLSLAASAVTYHVAALEQMGLVQRTRRGRSVTVSRSERGERLLALYGADRLTRRHTTPC